MLIKATGGIEIPRAWLPADATDLAILSDLREPSGNAPPDTSKPVKVATGVVSMSRFAASLGTLKTGLNATKILTVRFIMLSVQGNATDVARGAHLLPNTEGGKQSSKIFQRERIIRDLLMLWLKC